MFGYLWAYCEAILPFLWLQGGAPNNGGKYTLLGSCTGGSDVCYDVTLCFLSRALGNRLFSFSLMLDNDCLAMKIIWRNLETDKRNSK